MNDQCQLMNQYPVINRSQSYKTNPSQQLMNQSQSLNQFQILNSETASQPALVSQMNPPQMLNLMVSQAPMFSQPSMLNQLNLIPQSYGNLPHQPHIMAPMNNLKFPNQMNPNFRGVKQGRSNWKGKKAPDNRRKDVRRKETSTPAPPCQNDQNGLKAGRFYQSKKKFNRMGPYAHAPRNTTSYLIRAKKEGGIASLVSPCPVTPAVLPTPNFSPSREALVDMAKEEWGVDGYGSMKGLIRLRSSPGHEAEMEMEMEDYEDEDEDSCESDVEEHLEVERRLDHDLSRFEMVYPNINGSDCTNVLGNRVDDQDTQILQLEEENLSLKERLYLMERELGDIKRRMQSLERQNNNNNNLAAAVAVEEEEEEEEQLMIQNVSGNESDGTTEEDKEAEQAPSEQQALLQL